MLFGASAGLAMLTLVAVREPLLEGWRPYVAVSTLGAAYVLAAYAIATAVRAPGSTIENIGCGCFYAAAGYFFLVVVGIVAAVSTAAPTFVIQGYAALASLLGFIGLGLIGGLMLARFRRSAAAAPTARRSRNRSVSRDGAQHSCGVRRRRFL